MTFSEIIANALFIPLDFYLIVRLYNYAFTKKREAQRIRLGRWLLCMAALAVLVLLRFRPLPYIVVIVSFVLLTGYERDRQRKALIGLAALSICVYSMLLYDLITRVLPRPNMEDAVFAFFYQVFLWAVYRILIAVLYGILRRNISGKAQPVPGNTWSMLLIILLICLGAYLCCYYTAILQHNNLWSALAIPLSVAMLFISNIIPMLYDSLSSLVSATREKTLLDQQLQLQNEHYASLDAAQKRIAAISHDMKNHLRTASRLAASADSGELAGYLDSVARGLGEAESVVSTGNPGLDSILNIKLAELAAAGIAVDIQTHIPPCLRLTFEQAVVILGNLLDNAREASLALEPEAQHVRVRLSYANEVLFLQVENTAPPVTDWEDGLPRSTKGDALMHGLGLKNVRKAVEENGSMLVKSEDGVFSVTVTLYRQASKNDNNPSQN